MYKLCSGFSQKGIPPFTCLYLSFLHAESAVTYTGTIVPLPSPSSTGGSVLRNSTELADRVARSFSAVIVPKFAPKRHSVPTSDVSPRPLALPTRINTRLETCDSSCYWRRCQRVCVIDLGSTLTARGKCCLVAENT